ncbi:hypothetical protein [Streptomyces rimosus]|uniref:hypothetical protein n=1 Tax=Streptomyces rimosus TaxID=1927 RepID=UPI003789C01B
MATVPAARDPEVRGLDAVARLVPTWASSRGLALVPVIPETYDEGMPTVHLTAEQMTPEAFTDLAATAGAHLLYSCQETFDLASLELDEDEEQRLDAHARERMDAVRRRAAAYQGRCHDLRLVFAADGVLHYWSAEPAAWYAAISAEIDEVLSVLDEEGVETRDHPPVDQPVRLSEKEITQLVMQLRETSEFREAASQAQRQRIVRRLVGPRVANYWEVVERAGDAVDAASSEAFAELEAQLSTLADELLSDPEFRESCAKARKFHTVAFLKGRSGGYKPPTRLVEILLDQVAKKTRAEKR